jgi:hypothetical protein
MSSDHSKTLAFIEDYRSFTALWDVNHKDYTNKIKRNDALSTLAINYEMSVNRLAPSDPYMGRTAPLPSRRCILNTYSTNIRTEYFKHAA